MKARRTAYIGLGSNLDQPAQQCRRAMAALAALHECTLEARSGLYRNPPMGPQDQPEYVNAVVALSTTLEARALLDELQRIERQQGRERSALRWGPRVIDLDLLLFGDEVIAEHGLSVPHPGIAERAFVLVPLAEVAPTLHIPGHGPLEALLDSLDTAAVVALDAAATAAAE